MSQRKGQNWACRKGASLFSAFTFFFGQVFSIHKGKEIHWRLAPSSTKESQRSITEKRGNPKGSSWPANPALSLLLHGSWRSQQEPELLWSRAWSAPPLPRGLVTSHQLPCGKTSPRFPAAPWPHCRFPGQLLDLFPMPGTCRIIPAWQRSGTHTAPTAPSASSPLPHPPMHKAQSIPCAESKFAEGWGMRVGKGLHQGFREGRSPLQPPLAAH